MQTKFDISRPILQLSSMNFTLTLVLALVSTFAASAQEVRPVKLRTVCFQHVQDVKKVIAISGGENPTAVEIELFTTVISEEVDAFVTDGKLTFVVEDGQENGKTKYKTVATANAVAGPRQLAIFIPGDEGGPLYRCFVVDDSLRNFPMGSTMAVNLSPVAFRFVIGEHSKSVNPGNIEKIPMARKTNDRGQVSVIIGIADKESPSGWRAVNQTRWFSGEDKRDLAIGFIHPKTKQPTVNCYADTPAFLNQ
jgi:hypothetical protein